MGSSWSSGSDKQKGLRSGPGQSKLDVETAYSGGVASRGKRLAMSPREEKATTGATVLPFPLSRDKTEERYIQSDLAGIVHLLRQATSTASTAHAIARRRRGAHPILGDPINSLQIEALDQMVQSMGKAEDATERALRDAVGATPLLSRSYKPSLSCRSLDP
jgi:hypothetical protein